MSISKQIIEEVFGDLTKNLKGNYSIHVEDPSPDGPQYIYIVIKNNDTGLGISLNLIREKEICVHNVYPILEHILRKLDESTY